MNNCESCRFFDRSDFTCRRHAPIAVDATYHHEGVRYSTTTTHWPSVQLGDWCGDFQVRMLVDYEPPMERSEGGYRGK